MLLKSKFFIIYLLFFLSHVKCKKYFCLKFEKKMNYLIEKEKKTIKKTTKTF